MWDDVLHQPGHGVLVVLVVYLEVGVVVLASPVRHYVEGTGVSTRQRSYLIFQNINVEI